MKIPIFEEVQISEFKKEILKEIILDSRIGKVPTFINLSTLDKIKLEESVNVIEEIFRDLNIHPRFPYPTYIISNRQLNSEIPNVRTVKELPEHFFKKVKRPNNRELQLLNKLSLKIEKINNIELYQSMNDLVAAENPQKKLYEETKELFFLELLHKKFFDKKGKK